MPIMNVMKHRISADPVIRIPIWRRTSAVYFQTRGSSMNVRPANVPIS